MKKAENVPLYINADRLFEVERALEKYGIFICGYTKRIINIDSNTTIMDFAKLFAWLDENKSKYSEEEFETYLQSWESVSYLSPMRGILAIVIRRRLRELTTKEEEK